MARSSHNRLPRWAALTMTLTLGSCSLWSEAKGKLAAGEIEDLEMVLEAVNLASDETKLTMLSAGMAMMAEDHWSVGSCGQAFEAVARASAETKQTMIAAALEDCDYMCPSGRGREEAMGAVAHARALDKGRLLVSACDEEGPEPVFGGVYLDRRQQMSITDFWVYRAMFAITQERLVDNIGSESALELWEGFEQLRDEVADRLVLHLPPLDVGLELPGSSATLGPRVATIVLVTPDGISVDGQQVASLTDLQLAPADSTGQLIVPLHEALKKVGDALVSAAAVEDAQAALQEVPVSGNPSAGEGAKAKREEGKVGKKGAKMARAKGSKVEMSKRQVDKEIAQAAGVLGALRDGSELDGVFGSSGIVGIGGVGAELGSTATPGPTHRLLLQCDRRVPGELLRQLLHTAQQSSFAEVQLAVFNGDEGRQAVIDTLPAAVRHFDVRGDPDEMPPLALVLMLNDRGITVAGADAVLRPEAMGTPLPEEPTLPILADGEYDHRQLTRILSYVKDEYPDDERVILVAADGVPYEAVIKALDAARSDPQAQSADGRARTLFPYVVVSTESAMPSVRTPQPNSGGSGSAAGSEGARVGTLGGEVIILGALDKSLVDATVRRHLNQIKYCYVRELKSQPGLAGKVVVKFVIAKDGSVSSATTKSSTMRNPTVEGCINGRFMRFQFPKPKGGGIVIVSYPFLFSPG